MPTATSTEGEPTHDLTLYDGTTTYGFILCDAQGNPNPFAIDRSPTNRTSIKMSQGSSKYDDLQGPHLSLSQSDWSGGRGLEDFEDDQSRFFDNYRLNTWMHGRVILGPQETYGYGYRDQDNVMPGSVSWTGLYGANRYLANKFTASSYEADKCYIHVRKVGTPNGGLTLELCADSGGDPGTILKTSSSSAYHAEVDKVADFDAEVDTESDLNDHADAAHDGAVGLLITNDNTTAAYGTMNMAAVNQTTAIASYWINMNDASFDDAGQLWNVVAQDGSSNNSFLIIMARSGGNWLLQSFCYNDVPTFVQVGANYTLSSGWNKIDVHWSAATAPTANDGWMQVSVNGVLVQSATGMDNDTHDIDVIHFGSTVVPAGPSGSYYMDTLAIGALGAWDITDTVSVFRAFDWADTQTLTANPFHIKVYAESGSDDATNHWEVGTSTITGNTQKSTAGSSWASATNIDLYFRIVDADDSWIAHFYEYKGQMYFVTAPDDATAPEIFINGDRGAADSNTGALTTLVDATKSWTTDEWAGSVAVITAGPGYRDELNWRVIVSNTATALTVSPAWATTHTTSTEYVIVASDKFTAQAGHGLTVPVTDVLISKDVIYYAQGDGVAMRRHYEYNNSGTWTASDWDDDGGANFAKFLKVIEDPVNGAQVWKANDSLSSEPSVAKAPAQAWGTDLTFETAIPVGNRNERMTGLEIYGDPGVLWPFKEASLWDVANDIPNEKPIREMKAVASFKNGRAHLVQGVYLYFSLLNSLQRYFRNNLDDVGPWAGAGLPADRQGVIYHMQGYPAFFLCALDGGASNYSSVLLSTGHGDWHEFYRAPEKGQRIRRLHMQVIPGSTIDRLWVSQGTDVLWLPMPSDTLDPYRDSNYKFTHEGHVISAWHYANMQDVTKFWNSLKVFAESLTAYTTAKSSEQIIEAEYQTDGDTETDTWTAINGTFDTVPVEEVAFKSANDLTGRRLRYRLRFLTTDNTKTPKMKAVIVEALGRVAPKWQYSFTFRAKDENLDREGDDDSYVTVETLITKVDEWSASAVPLTMRCLYSPFDNKTVFAEAAPMRPYLVTPDEQSESHVSQMTVYEK